MNSTPPALSEALSLLIGTLVNLMVLLVLCIILKGTGWLFRGRRWSRWIVRGDSICGDLRMMLLTLIG
jgi:hypothetical protein